MRRLATATRIRSFLAALGREAREPATVYLTGGRLTVRHFDLVAQALAKISRGHERDLGDVQAMFDRGLVDREEVRRRFETIEADLYRFPALDAPTFRRAVERAVPRQSG